MMLTVILWLLWKAHPNVAICAAFWLSAIWMIRSKHLIRHSTRSGFERNGYRVEWGRDARGWYADALPSRISYLAGGGDE
jgi:hypothetical protein